MRKSFPFSFWYFGPITDKKIDEIKLFTEIYVKKLLKISKIQLYIFRGENEKDRLRVICLNVFVNRNTALDLRSTIINELGYSLESNVIPSIMYEMPITPNIFMIKKWDTSLEKWGTTQKYKCLNNKNLQTKEIEKILTYCLTLKDPKLLKFTKKYIIFKEKDVNTSVLGNKDISSNVIFDREISNNIKKELNKYFDLCINYFKKFHKDSSLRSVKKITDDIYSFDFSKSNYKCRICKVIHNSNRQYLTYSKK